MKNGEMLKKLFEAVDLLPGLLKSPGNWKSVYIDYETPIVERIYIDLQDLGVRLSLHKIHECKEGEAFFHPHPWPSAIFVWSGRYRTRIGYGSGTLEPPKSSSIYLNGGSFYEMIDPNEWHSVEPIDEPVYSAMVSGDPWSREMPLTPNKKLNPLSDSQKLGMFQVFEVLSELDNPSLKPPTF